MAGLGFEVVHTETFLGTCYSDEDSAATETYAVLWHPDGILGAVESHQGTRRNTAKIWYNFRPTDGRWRTAIHSGRLARTTDERVWVGDHDAREAIAFSISKIRAHADFLPVWVERPYLHLTPYTVGKGLADFDERIAAAEASTERIIAALPDHVRAAIDGRRS